MRKTKTIKIEMIRMMPTKFSSQGYY
jgi:hypothetical protein